MANSSDEMRQFREAFSLFDKDHDDIIAPQELGKSILILANKHSIESLNFKALFFVHVVYHRPKLIYKKFNNKLVEKSISILLFVLHKILKPIIVKPKMTYAKHFVYLIKMEQDMSALLNLNML